MIIDIDRPPELPLDAEMDKIYRTSKGMKVGCWVLAVLCAVLVFLLPGTFLMLWIAHGAYVRITDDKLIVRWIGTREISWSDVSALRWGRAAGAIGAALRPLSYELHSKPRTHGNIAVGAFESTDELVAELTRRTGQAVLAA
jgi:hypothetical protein